MPCLLVLALRAVLAPCKGQCTCCIHVLVPEIAFHSFCHHYLTTFIVNVGVWQISEEADARFLHLASDASPQRACINKNMPTWSKGASVPFPCLAEKCLSLKVLVKLVT